ncbi:hypothetical protein P4S72_16895 [Vibrio sp. PP-XX7]
MQKLLFRKMKPVSATLMDRIDNDGTGYTGSGYANTENASGNQVTWSINAATAGSYILEWRYASASENSRPATVKLDSAQAM